MPMTGFICQDSYLEKIAKLSDQEVGRLFRALMKYHATGEATELKGREDIAFDFIREDIDSAEQRYRAKCEQARQNRMGGNGKTDVDSSQRASTAVNGSTQNIIKYKEIEKDTLKRGVHITPPARFTPPTPEEVREYCRERGNSVDPDRFCDFYAGKGWMIGKNPMEDWKAVVRTWEKEDEEKQRSPKRKTVAAQEYAQRDYTDVVRQIQKEQDQDMARFMEREETGA